MLPWMQMIWQVKVFVWRKSIWEKKKKRYTFSTLDLCWFELIVWKFSSVRLSWKFSVKFKKRELSWWIKKRLYVVWKQDFRKLSWQMLKYTFIFIFFFFLHQINSFSIYTLMISRVLNLIVSPCREMVVHVSTLKSVAPQTKLIMIHTEMSTWPFQLYN